MTIIAIQLKLKDAPPQPLSLVVVNDDQLVAKLALFNELGGDAYSAFEWKADGAEDVELFLRREKASREREDSPQYAAKVTKETAVAIAAQLTTNERVGVRFGMFPERLMQPALTKIAGVWRTQTDASRELAVAVMDAERALPKMLTKRQKAGR